MMVAGISPRRKYRSSMPGRNRKEAWETRKMRKITSFDLSFLIFSRVFMKNKLMVKAIMMLSRLKLMLAGVESMIKTRE